jgi:hypothetical protein
MAYFKNDSVFIHDSRKVNGFLFIFLQIHTYNALTPSPRLPNAQANPQKNRPNTMVYRQSTRSMVKNPENTTLFPFPNWVNMYFIPLNAAENAEGNKQKKIICATALV